MINRRVLWDHQVVQLPSTVTVALTMQEEASDSMGNVAPRFLSALTVLANGVLAEQTFCNFLPLIVKQTTGNLQVRRHDTVGPDKLTMRLGNMKEIKHFVGINHTQATVLFGAETRIQPVLPHQFTCRITVCFHTPFDVSNVQGV